MKTMIGIACILAAACCGLLVLAGMTPISFSEDAGIVDTVCTFLTTTLTGLMFGEDVAFAETVEPETELKDIAIVDELKDAFNADKGCPRLLVLLSPT